MLSNLDCSIMIDNRNVLISLKDIFSELILITK